MVEPEASVQTELASLVKKEAMQQTAKWLVFVLGSLLVLAVSGWWFVLEPRIGEFIRLRAGAIPKGAIVASTVECNNLEGTWVPFAEGTGRFLVGAGEETIPAFANWMPIAGGVGVPLTTYKVLQPGGEEKHKLSVAELPPHSHDVTLDRQWGEKSNQQTGWGSDDGMHPATTVATATTGLGEPSNVVPPFVGVYFCKRL